MFSLCGYNSGVSLKELVFISYVGYIRGAVAFGLVLRLDNSLPNRAVIVTTALFLVIFGIIFMGSTVSTMSRLFFQTTKEVHENEDQY